MCAINLRVQSNNCPICRIPFVALLQLRLLRKKDLIKLDHKPAQLHLPIVKMEHLNVNNLNMIDLNHENIIIEDTYQIKVESANSAVRNKPKPTNIYEAVTIYEAFNNSSTVNYLYETKPQLKRIKTHSSNEGT